MMYRSIKKALCAGAMVLFAHHAGAALVDRGNGLIYDEEQDLTWIQNASLSGFLTQSAAVTWAENLVYAGFDDWRLPTTTQFDDPTCSGDVRGGFFYEHRTDCLGGEMEILTFNHDPWNNDLFKDQDGNRTINRTRYWADTQYRDFTDPCINYPAYDVACNLANDNGDRTDFYWQWGFTGFGGINGPAYKTTLEQGNGRFAWAVRDGDVTSAVPVPAAVYLFGSGLIGLLGLARRKSA